MVGSILYPRESMKLEMSPTLKKILAIAITVAALAPLLSFVSNIIMPFYILNFCWEIHKNFTFATCKTGARKAIRDLRDFFENASMNA